MICGLELKQLYERTDDERHFQLAQMLSGADARTVPATEVQHVLGTTL